MSTDVERHIFNGRTLLGNEDEDGAQVMGWPEVAYESIRAINHLTSNGLPIPAPIVYDVLGNLKGIGHMLPQALQQLSIGLEASLHEFDVYDHNGEPSVSVARAKEAMGAAAEHASQIGALLEEAQRAINSQGYKSPQEE
jgi:hypothetical protein